MKLDALKFGLACGILSALSMFLLVIDALYMGRGVSAVKLIVPIFPGYGVSWQGAGIGVLYGLVCGTVYSAIMASVYNALLGMKMGKKAGRKKK